MEEGGSGGTASAGSSAFISLPAGELFAGQSNESIEIDRSDASFWRASASFNFATFMPKTHCAMTKSLSIYGPLETPSYL